MEVQEKRSEVEQNTKEKVETCGKNNLHSSNENKGLPNFLIDTILKKVPSPPQSKELIIPSHPSSSLGSISESAHHTVFPTLWQTNKFWNIQEQFNCDPNEMTAKNNNDSSYKTNFTPDQVAVFQNISRLDLQIYSHRLMQWQQFLQSSLSHSFLGNMKSNLSKPTIDQTLNNDYGKQNSHFVNFHTNKRSQFDGGSHDQVAEMQTLKSGVQSGSHRTNKNEKSIAKNDILLQLDRLSHKVGEKNVNSKMKELKSSRRSPTPKRHSENRHKRHNCSSVSSAMSMIETTSNDESKAWPAWVYCTRYSDRPSAGPRIRRSKCKVKTTDQSDADKRARTTFSPDQLEQLQREFKISQYLTEERRVRLSSELCLSVAQIKVWFQNKRAKVKKTSGVRNSLAMQLIAQGLYNHCTQQAKEAQRKPEETESTQSE